MPITMDELRKMIQQSPVDKEEPVEKEPSKESIKEVKANFVAKLNLEEPDKPPKPAPEPKPDIDTPILDPEVSVPMPSYGDALEYLKGRMALGDESKFFIKMYAWAESKRRLTEKQLKSVGRAMVEEPLSVLEHKMGIYRQFEEYLLKIEEIEKYSDDGRILNKCSDLRSIITQYNDKGSLTTKQFRYVQTLVRHLGL